MFTIYDYFWGSIRGGSHGILLIPTLLYSYKYTPTEETALLEDSSSESGHGEGSGEEEEEDGGKKRHPACDEEL